ncbi:unnamed protein product [Ostreobium quekettii]|uniref:Uncharacterized protein n=1 Tax=Ostreobium quekettii TaxID=121088 RepID=A0A8S1J2K1_9CHLO|nr:unnamed protein product [Ostreobium quekettii]
MRQYAPEMHETREMHDIMFPICSIDPIRPVERGVIVVHFEANAAAALCGTRLLAHVPKLAWPVSTPCELPAPSANQDQAAHKSLNTVSGVQGVSGGQTHSWDHLQKAYSQDA